MARLRPRARAREKGGRSKQSACGNRSAVLSQSVCHARAMSSALRISRMLNLPVCSYYAPGFTHWQLRRALSNRRLLLQELRALAPPHPLLSVSPAAAATLTDLPATQLLSPLPPPLLALCVRGRHHPAGQLMQLTSTDARLASSSLIRPTTTDSEMPL